MRYTQERYLGLASGHASRARTRRERQSWEEYAKCLLHLPKHLSCFPCNEKRDDKMLCSITGSWWNSSLAHWVCHGTWLITLASQMLGLHFLSVLAIHFSPPTLSVTGPQTLGPQKLDWHPGLTGISTKLWSCLQSLWRAKQLYFSCRDVGECYGKRSGDRVGMNRSHSPWFRA